MVANSMFCYVHYAKRKRSSFMGQALFDCRRVACCLLIAPLLLLVTSNGPWARVAAARSADWSSNLHLVSTAYAISQGNSSTTSACAGGSQTFLTTASVQSDRADPVPTDNTAVLCLSTAFTLGQRIWADLNGNGLQETGEPGVVGVTVQLLSETGALLQTTISVANGAYNFTGVTLGTYRVRVIPPTGYQFTPSNQGSDDTVDSDIDPTTGRTTLIVLADATGSRDWAAGLFRPVTIGDRIWEDVNGNGVQDSGEPGLANMTVQLFDSRDTLIASTTTTADGAYTFQGLLPGDYYLLVVPPTTP
jgi:hypothetical protein